MLKSSTSNAIPVRVSTSALPWTAMSFAILVSDAMSGLWLSIGLEKENLCLYGFPNELWEVNLPAEEVPPELPEPALGINFARDGMQEKDWLSLVAVHSDAWLLAVAFYFGARFGFDKADRIERKGREGTTLPPDIPYAKGIGGRLLLLDSN
ncbi:PHD finger protein ALFIN-like 4 [Vitis vinifera]|uniref:PHD finger protein ALFIN-LIKE n=1 Tax=Vitis vinifera TaxID=29760 RepID=A0A438J9A1_VITVI|nr:PHD finger protein ALFIN-like 4 [Vitis vinifera]